VAIHRGDTDASSARELVEGGWLADALRSTIAPRRRDVLF